MWSSADVPSMSTGKRCQHRKKVPGIFFRSNSLVDWTERLRTIVLLCSASIHAIRNTSPSIIWILTMWSGVDWCAKRLRTTLRTTALPWCRAADRESNPERAAKCSGAVVRLCTVVVDEDVAEAAITEKRTSESSYVCRCLHPARSLGVKTSQ